VNSQNLAPTLRLAVVLLFVSLFAASSVWKSSAQQPTVPAKPSPTPQQQPLPPDAPVEQTRKNIQVLKGISESQFYNLMNYVSVSLGVQCTYCHVTAGKNADGQTKWVWESDEKPQKLAARRMMRMTMQLNQTNLADFHNQRVTCYTCHRGSTDPARLVPLPVAKSGHEPIPGETTTAAKTSPAPPTPEEILARYVAAVGGRDAIARAKTVVMRGTREASQGRVWPVEVTMEGADKFAVLANLPAQGQQPASEVRQVYSDGKGWIKSPQGVREVTPAELPGVRSSILLLAPVKLAEPFPAMTYGGVGEVGGREAYVLVGKPAADTTVRYYFDRETSLLVRQLATRETVLNALPEQVDFEDYRDVGGLKLPFKISVSAIDTYNSSKRTFTEIRTNVPVDEGIFAMPAAPPKP
jgi:hypothetical protein